MVDNKRKAIGTGRKKSGLDSRNARFGYIFIAPWLIGVTLFFLLPMKETGVYIFSSVKAVVGGTEKTYVGLQNVRTVFFEDPANVRLILTSLLTTFTDSLMILVFSLAVALMLHKRFPTQTFARMLYMIPVIMSTGIILQIFKQDLFAQSAIQGSDRTIFQSVSTRDLFYSLGLSIGTVNFFTGIINRILEIVWRSGVQILLFYTSLKSIPSSYYEVGKVEGATAWQAFINITFPLISPYLVLYAIYTVIDSFMYVDNPVMQKIEYYFNLPAYEYNTILSVFYSVGVLIVVLVMWLVTSRISSKNTGMEV